MSEFNCVSHHYACDCREAYFKRLEEENRILKKDNNPKKIYTSDGFEIRIGMKILSSEDYKKSDVLSNSFDLIYYEINYIHPLSPIILTSNYINNTFRYKIFNYHFNLERNWYYAEKSFFDKNNLKEFILEN